MVACISVGLALSKFARVLGGVFPVNSPRSGIAKRHHDSPSSTLVMSEGSDKIDENHRY